jgi:hypothetical protein
MLEAGYPEVLASGIAEHMARSRHGGVTAAVLPDLEELFGRNPRGVGRSSETKPPNSS